MPGIQIVQELPISPQMPRIKRVKEDAHQRTLGVIDGEMEEGAIIEVLLKDPDEEPDEEQLIRALTTNSDDVNSD